MLLFVHNVPIRDCGSATNNFKSALCFYVIHKSCGAQHLNICNLLEIQPSLYYFLPYIHQFFNPTNSN